MRVSKDDVAFSTQAVPPPGNGQQDKRDRIIEQAIIMFNGVGYDRVRVSDITDSLNMGKGTFYLYFRNKKDLLLGCFDHVGELIQELESLPAIREGDFFAKTRPRVESIHDREWFPGLINLLRTAELSPDAEVKAKAREAYEMIASPLKRDLETAIETGRARDVDADLAAYGFIGLAENLSFRSRLDDRYSPEEVVSFMVDSVTRWLSSGVSPGDQPQEVPEKPVCLTGRDGTQFNLEHVRYSNGTRLTAALGQAQIDINPAAVSSLTILESGDECVAHVKMADGTEVQVHIDGSIVISGDAIIGSVRIAMRDLSSLTFPA